MNRSRGSLALLVGAIFIAVTIVVFVIWALSAVTSVPPEATESPSVSASATTVPSDEPTPQQTTPSASPEPSAPTKEVADVVLTRVAWSSSNRTVEVSAYVANAIEEGGTCTVTVADAGVSVSASKDAVPDATTTSCGMVVVNGASLTNGTYQVTVRYESSHRVGEATGNVGVKP